MGGQSPPVLIVVKSKKNPQETKFFKWKSASNKAIDIYFHGIYIVYTENNMIKTMIQHGNSSALVIDKPIMELLNIEQNTPMEIVTDGTNIIISPVKDKTRLDKLKASLTKINAKHSRTLKRLAE